MTKSARGTRFPNSCYRHPVNGERVVVGEDVDAELQCLEQAGMVSAGVLARMRELSGQSAQNRARIARRCLGEDIGIPREAA